MGILKSKFHGSYWDEMKVVSLLISDLWPSVEKAEVHNGIRFYESVKKDIEENGLNFPLLVVDANRKQVIEQKKKYGNRVRDLPFPVNTDDLDARQYVVWGGSNRFEAAQELGFTYVDCVVFPNGDFKAAHGKQKLHRAPYQGKFYGLKKSK